MNEVDGVILAGGQSRRMGGQDKSLCLIAGRPMIDWVAEAVRPQVRLLAINSHYPTQTGAGSLPVIPDRTAGFHGPLMGLYSAMEWFVTRHRTSWLALFSCDMPFLPDDLVARLQATADARGASAALVSLEGELQPTASLWHSSLLPLLHEAVEQQRMAGFKQFLRTIDYAPVDFDASSRPAFFNVNSPRELEQARQMAEANGKTETRGSVKTRERSSC